MKKWLVVCMLAAGMQAFAASPKFPQLDAQAINAERWADAVEIMGKMIATKEPLPKDFKYVYGEALAWSDNYEKAFNSFEEYTKISFFD